MGDKFLLCTTPAHTGELCIAYLVATYNECFTICNKLNKCQSLFYTAQWLLFTRERERERQHREWKEQPLNSAYSNSDILI